MKIITFEIKNENEQIARNIFVDMYKLLILLL